MRSRRSLPPRWLMMAIVVATCWMLCESMTETSSEATESRRLPREVVAVQQAVRKRLGLATDNPLLKRMQREHNGTDVLAFQLPTRMRPIEVHRSGGPTWRLSALTAEQVGQVPVVVLLGKATLRGKPALGGQLFVVALSDPKRPERTRICMMFTTSVPPAHRAAKRDT